MSAVADRPVVLDAPAPDALVVGDLVPPAGSSLPSGDRGLGTTAVLVRLAACVALALFGAQAWGDMVRPGAPGVVLAAAAAGGALGLLALACAGLRRPLRLLALLGLVVLGALTALLLAGVPTELLGPRQLDELGSGLGQGISALPGLSVPYRGVDEFNRIAMLLGGTLLAVAGPLAACWPGRRGRRVAGVAVPVILLTALYAVPAIQLRLEHPLLEGAAFALLLAAVLFAGRLGRRELPAAAAVVAVAALGGLALAPRLDADEPWIDYESLAQGLGERGTSSFSWDHRYGPLDWPRDGREVLRIRAPSSSYWKATTLADFDGARWREVRSQGVEDDPESESPQARWVQTLRVSVRNLRTRQFVSAGTTLGIDRSPRTVVPGAPGSYATAGRPLRRGHGYLARAYVPEPSAEQLAGAGDLYPTSMWPYLSMQLPVGAGGPPPVDPATGVRDPRGPTGFVVFSPWGDERPALAYQGRGFGDRRGTEWVRDSAYARTYALAQRLAAGADTPYDYVRRVQEHLTRGFTYTETPPQRRIPLDAFLFEDRAGYCQQFSGAMALLLRMGGVPARVASGFSPGTRDEARDEFVVRDYDAHSWVEAYFPGSGWITFDPTPSIAPPRAQVTGADAVAEGSETGDESSAGPAAERQTDASGIDGGAAESGEGGVPVLLLAGGGALLLLGAGATLAVLRGRRRRAAMSSEEAVAELERALRRSGRLPARGLTLAALEDRLRSAPDAAAYVHAVRSARFGFGGAPPSGDQRRALRRWLGSGLGLRGWVRSVWALPPW